MAKRIPYRITDPAALESAYPELFYEETIVKKKIHTDKLYKIVKLHNELGRAIDGVHIGVNEDYKETRGILAEADTVAPAFLKGKE